jgi:hypothetical protein
LSRRQCNKPHDSAVGLPAIASSPKSLSSVTRTRVS